MNKFQKRRKRDQERGLDRDCPKCGVKAGRPCRNLSARGWQRGYIPATHKERHHTIEDQIKKQGK